MARYRKKPIVIEAIQFIDGTDEIIELQKFMGGKQIRISYKEDKAKFIIDTLEGKYEATEGDYIIKGIKGEFYPCKPDIFEKSYDLVE